MTDYPELPDASPSFIAQPYASRPVRPPLTARAKRGAAIAGAVGFLLLGLGYAVASIAIGLALLVAFFAVIARPAAVTGPTSDSAPIVSRA